MLRTCAKTTVPSWPPIPARGAGVASRPARGHPAGPRRSTPDGLRPLGTPGCSSSTYLQYGSSSRLARPGASTPKDGTLFFAQVLSLARLAPIALALALLRCTGASARERRAEADRLRDAALGDEATLAVLVEVDQLRARGERTEAARRLRERGQPASQAALALARQVPVTTPGGRRLKSRLVALLSARRSTIDASASALEIEAEPDDAREIGLLREERRLERRWVRWSADLDRHRSRAAGCS